MQHCNVEDGLCGAGVGAGVDAGVGAGVDDEVAANLCGWCFSVGVDVAVWCQS